MDKFLQNNTVMKVIAFLLAFMLWMIVSLDDNPQTPFTQQEGQSTMEDVHVEALYDADEYSIMEMDNETAQVILSGKKPLLAFNKLRTGQRLYLDLNDLEEGTHRVPVQYEGFPNGLRVEIYPAAIRVVVEKRQTRSFPVTVELTGTVEAGYTVEQPVIIPDHVEVKAPSTFLNEITAVKGIVDVDGADKPLEEEVVLKAYDEDGNEIEAELSPGSVEVTIPVRSPSVTVPLKLNKINELPDGVSLSGMDVFITEVEVFAPLEALEGLTEVQGTIDLSKITSTQQLQVEIPLAKDWINIEPQVIPMEIRVGQTQERIYKNIPIEVIGLKEGLTVQFTEREDGQADLNIQGSNERLSALTRDNVRVFINVSGLEEGEHQVPVRYAFPGYGTYLQTVQQNKEINIRIITADEAEETFGHVSEEESEGE